MIEKDKRWLNREQRWRRPGELFSPGRYAVDGIDERIAKPFVEQHHYSGSYPAGRFAVGLYGVFGRLCGVAVFSVPMNQHTIPKYAGLQPNAGCELGRFVCLPEVRYNGESWFLSRAFELLDREKPEIRAIVSYADPLERTQGAALVKPAHYGTIYQASNATFAGRSYARILTFAPDGSVVSNRAIQKLVNEERGWEYVQRQLLRWGAVSRAPGETLASWARRALATTPFTRRKHPGNLAYVFGLDRRVKNQIRSLHHGGLPYPKKEAA